MIDHHGPTLLITAAFAAIAKAAFAVWARSKPAAIAVAAMGAFALLIFLLIDLPDAGQVGALDNAEQSFIDAEAIPQEGFWLEMLGALALAFTGAALATMTADSNWRCCARGRRRRPRSPSRSRRPCATPADPTAGSGSEPRIGLGLRYQR